MKRTFAKIATCLIFVFALLTSFVMTACGEDNSNASIELSKKSIEILLGETPNNSETIRVKVKDATDATVMLDYDMTSISITKEDLGQDVTEFTVTAHKVCDLDVTVSAAGKSTFFHVSAITPVSSIKPVSKTLCMAYDKTEGGQYLLSSDLVVFTPEETGQKGLTFTLANEIAGVSIVDNVLTVEPGIEVPPSKISVVATSSATNKEMVKTTLEICVAPKIIVSDEFITITETQSGAPVAESYNLARNSEVQDILKLSVYIKNQEHGYKILPRAVFENDSTGLFVNEIIKTDSADGLGVVYDFVFNFNQGKNNSYEDNLRFEFYYEDFVDVSTLSNKIAITTYDEVTSITYTVDGLATSETEFNVYTTYPRGVEGLAIKFTSLPTNAQKRDIFLFCDATQINIFDQDGNRITTNETNIGPEATVYFVAKDSQKNPVEVRVCVKDEDGTERLSKTLTLHSQVGATDMAFIVGGRIFTSPTFYVENQEDGKNTQDIHFYVKPLNVNIDGLEVVASGEGFSVGNLEYYGEYWEDALLVGAVYKLPITAIENVSGEGNIQIKFATGLQISCHVVSFTKFESFSVDVDSEFDKSASVGELVYDDNGLRNIAVKNGHNVPLKLSSFAKIETITYRFADLKLVHPEDVYDPNSEYNLYNIATDELLETMDFADNSEIISAAYLKSLQHIAPLEVGKVWVEITCTGKMVDDFNEYVDTTIVRYVMVEIYNPIVSIDVNTKNVTLYPYDEVGEQNRDLSEKTFIITLNKDNLAPTYYKLETSYENTREGVTIFEFEEIDNYQYKVSLKTRTYSIGGINEKIDDVSIDFSATNFNISFRVQVSIKIESPVLVDKIETINVPRTGIYMSALEQDELARTFKIMTKVLPENALNKDLIFRFEPDFKTSSNILSINNEGIITLRGNVGGSGNILVIPADGRMVDATGREYYRDNIGDVLIRIPITIADGTKEETALRISSLDQITNKNLHYLLIQDVVDFSFETLFDGEAFNGGLYGKSNTADGFVATITIKGGSLFDTLSENAIIKNINIAGESNASGMVANVSNGVIQNVNVNVYNDAGVYKATTVTSTADYVGGLVGENNGLIDRCIFAGSISGKTVGGLAGINKATITDSKVEIYNLPTGDTMSFSGDVVGGLVGEVAKYSIIQKSYIYNYSDNNIATTMGALVGHIATDSFVVSKCFAYNVVKQSTSSAWYHTHEASLVLDDVIYNIIDSYISYIDGSDNYKFYAHMVDRFNNVKVITAKSYPDIYLGTAAVWNVDGVTNGGYAFLNGVVAEQALTSEQLASMGIVDTNLSMQEATYTTEGGDSYTIAVMFAYKANGVALTTDEQGEMTLLNTISISELVGSALASGLIISSSNTNIIDTTAGSVIVRNTGVVTLTLQSKYDYEQQPKQIKVMVVNKIQDFKLVYNGYTLNSESVLPVKNGDAESVQSQVDTTIALVNREITLKQNDFTVGVYNEDGSDATFVIGRKLGTHVISSNFGDNANISFVLEMDSINDNALLSDQEKEEFAKIIERNNIVLAVKLAKGADKVETINVKKANISPIDVLNFDAYIISDLDDTVEGMQAFVFDENGISLEGAENVFDVVIEQKSQTYDAETGKYKIVYNVSVSIKTEYKSIRFEGQKYTLRLSANSDREIYAQVEISVATQEVLRVDFNHYPQMYSNQAGTMYATYQPSNVLSPNRYGLLEISLYPNYASYDYITVTAQAVNGEKLGLVALQKNGTVFNTESAENFVFIENGVRIYRKNNTDDLGIFYVKTIASANVKLNSVYSIEIKVYNEQSQTPLMTDSFNLIIVPQEKAGISINGVSGTTVALKGETLVADIMVEQIQSAPSVQILNLELTDTSNNATVVDVVLVNENYGTKYKLYKATITIPENAVSGFTIRATTSREINNELQYEVSDMKVYLYEFALDPETSGVKNETGSNVFVANKIFAKQLDINIGAKYYGINKAFYDSFLTSKIFYGENLRVNEEFNAELDPAMINNLKYNLYYVNNNKTTPIYNTETNTFNSNSVLQFDEVESESGDGYVLTVLGLVNTTQNMRLIINYQVKTENGAYITFVYEYDFKIKVEQYTDEDVPETISDANQFIAMADEDIEEPKDYILTKDIYLYEWEALPDTSKINSLDGNGFTITIMNFKTELEDTSTLNLALFNQVSQNTTLKNIRLNLYHVGEVQIDTTSIKNFNYAPIAIVNHGIITNTEVVAYKKATNVINPKSIGINASLPVVNDINSKIAGFVIENRGAITNSRVGGEKIKEVVVYDDGTVRATNITLPMMTISGKGEMAGFVYNNTGLVSSSFANNIRIINSTDIDYTTVTSGFVAYNTGSVLMSYVKGAKRNDTEIHATKYGIETAGVSTGFVYENDGIISDSYSNITLTNTSNNPGRTSSGFVYSNKENGQISTSYSFSRIIGSTTTQMNFSGVNERGDYLNKGRITNSYYYDGVIDENLSSVEDEYGKTAIRVTNVNVTDVFYGFSFETFEKENGIWTITATGPELIAANSETMSVRYKVGEVFAYANGYSYGSKINPIIIRDAKEYNEVLGNSKRTPVQANYSDNYIYGSYRMVNNIYLNTLNSKDATENGVTDYKLTSASMTLTGRYSSSGSGTSIGRFDGNGLTIYGLALSDTGVTAATDFGLFAKIEQDAMVMNVNIVLGAKNQENNVFGIEAKNIQNVGALAGSVHSANIVNVSVKSAYEGASEVTVRGKNIVGGIVGNVTGYSFLAYLTSKDISVRAVMNLATTELAPKSFNEYNRNGNNALASYAGGVIGAYDYYTDSTYNNLTFSNMYITSSPNALMLKTKGIMKIDGSTVGGVVGYVGPLTLIQDMLLELVRIEDETSRNTQAITTYGGFAGGLVGYNKGYLRQVRAEHEEEYQKEIEENVNKYYTTVNNDSIDRGNMQVFANTDYKPYAIGGLVGLMNSGKIEKAYSKINTINDEAKYAGGIIGYIIDVVDVKPDAEDAVNIDTCLEEVYAFGDVRAKEKTSGIVGRIDNTGVAIELDRVNALNYWGDWLLEDD